MKKFGKRLVSMALSVIMAAMIVVPTAAVPVNAATTIPSGALKYNGHNYYIYSGVADSWSAAVSYCKARGGHLATITSAGENAALYNYMVKKGYSNSAFGFTDEKVEGTWKWVTGEKATYTNWASGEPNNSWGTQNYAMFYNSNQWDDIEFNQSDSFICEWEYDLSSTKVNLSIGDVQQIFLNDYNGKSVSASYISSNSSVCKVSTSTGKIKAVGAGKCTITATKDKAKYTCTVIVNPKKVAGIKTIAVNKTSVQLTWTRQSGVTGYKVYMYDPDFGEWTRVKITASNNVLVKKLAKNTTYKFKISGYIKSGSTSYSGAFSKVFSVKTKK